MVVGVRMKTIPNEVEISCACLSIERHAATSSSRHHLRRRHNRRTVVTFRFGVHTMQKINYTHKTHVDGYRVLCYLSIYLSARLYLCAQWCPSALFCYRIMFDKSRIVRSSNSSQTTHNVRPTPTIIMHHIRNADHAFRRDHIHQKTIGEQNDRGPRANGARAGRVVSTNLSRSST